MNQTLFVGIDVSKGSNYVYAMNLDRKKLLSSNIPNTQDGANQIEAKLLELLSSNNLKKLIIVLESTGVYSAHIATFPKEQLSMLLQLPAEPFKPCVIKVISGSPLSTTLSFL